MGNKTLLLIMRKSLGWAQFSSINVTRPLKTNMDTQTSWALANVYPYTSVRFWYQFVKRLRWKKWISKHFIISSSSHPIHLHAGDGSMGWPYVAMPGSITGIAPAWLEGVTRPTARGCGASCSSKPPVGCGEGKGDTVDGRFHGFSLHKAG